MIRHIVAEPPEFGMDSAEMLEIDSGSASIPVLPYPTNSEMVLSVWAKSPKPCPVMVEALGARTIIDVTNEWKQYEIDIPSPTGSEIVLFVRDGELVDLYKMMVEVGNDPSDWVPAVEDTEDPLNNVQMWFHFGMDGLTIQKWVYDENLGDYVKSDDYPFSTLTDNEGYNIMHSDVGKVASFTRDKLSVPSIELKDARSLQNGIKVKQTSNGGWAWIAL